MWYMQCMRCAAPAEELYADTLRECEETCQRIDGFLFFAYSNGISIDRE